MPRKKTRKKQTSKSEDKPRDKQEELAKEQEKLRQRIQELEEQLKEAKRKREQPQLQLQHQLQETLANLANAFTGLKEAIEGNPDKLLRDAKGLVMAIANDPSTARASGFSSGINTAVIKNEVERALNGQISFNELINLIDNGWNWVKGFFVGDEAFQESVREVEGAKRKAAKSISDKIEEEYGA